MHRLQYQETICHQGKLQVYRLRGGSKLKHSKRVMLYFAAVVNMKLDTIADFLPQNDESVKSLCVPLTCHNATIVPACIL